MNTNTQLANAQLDLARHNMVENQVRPWEVLDARVLDVLATLPRAHFVPAPWSALAYADVALPIGDDQIMLKPVVEGRILQAVLPQGFEHVLEIGTGTGYFAACLARLAARVTSIDCRAGFIETATAKLRALGILNVECQRADALDGFAPAQAFDAIVVTGAVHALPPAFGEWLKPGGRIFAIVGLEPAMQAVLLRRAADGGWSEERLFETDVPYLAGAAPVPQFKL